MLVQAEDFLIETAPILSKYSSEHHTVAHEFLRAANTLQVENDHLKEIENV